jgi:predicted RNase H-like nuclease (RuvC/YqgF family)
MKKFRALFPLACISLAAPMFMLAPEQGGGSGGGEGGTETPKPEESPVPAEQPKPEGESLENKLTSANTLIARFYNTAKDLWSRLGTANNERARLESQFNAVSSDLQKEKEEHGKTKGLLATANTQVTGLTTERDNANKNVERLEKLCNLRGIDHTAVVPASQTSANSAGNVWEQYQNLRTQEKEGKAKPGSALAFYQKNSKALHEYQSAHRGES